jgi:uncharacterized protein YggL (DUF469 family)
MKPESIAITRKFNLGNYQTIDYTVSASLDQNEDPRKAIESLEKIINDYWEGRVNMLVSTAKKENQR